ncbi:hypothetical protein ACN4EE_07170 [Geminocystis sp. CENA526]|uniref:hypothetical protein n=1 Tax=Geminocystis sp. CENA526 TaxID=1355871 RepID=UPI003D6E88F4
MLITTTNYQSLNALDTGKNMLKDLGEKAINSSNNLTDLISNNFRSSLESLWNNWVANHFIIGFFVSHPFISIILIITLILTIWGIIQMIPSLLVKLWLFIFKSPFIFGKSLLQNNQQEVINQDFYSLILKKLEAIETKQNLLEKQISEWQK